MHTKYGSVQLGKFQVAGTPKVLAEKPDAAFDFSAAGSLGGFSERVRDDA